MAVIEAHDQCLEFWKQNETPCTVMLANHTEFQATITTFDRFTIVFKFVDKGEIGLFFKSGILGILPIGITELPSTIKM